MAKEPEKAKSTRFVRFRAKRRGFWNGSLVEPGGIVTAPDDLKSSWLEPIVDLPPSSATDSAKSGAGTDGGAAASGGSGAAGNATVSGGSGT